MKKLYSLFLALIITGTLFAQGTIVAFTIDPPAPTTTDVVKVYVDLMFTSMSCNLDNQGHSTAGSTTSAYAHHCVGMLSAICNTIDTFNLGMLPAGSHVFDLTLTSGSGGPPCTPGIIPDDQRNTTFTVTTATGIADMLNSIDFTVYPNPANGILNVITNGVKQSHIILTDVLGKVVYETDSSSEKIEIDLSNFHNGIYFIQIQTEGSTITKKIVKN